MQSAANTFRGTLAYFGAAPSRGVLRTERPRPATIRAFVITLLSLAAVWSGVYWILSLREPWSISPVAHEVADHVFLGVLPDPAFANPEHIVVLIGVYGKWSPSLPHWDRSIGKFSVGVGDVVASDGRTKLITYIRFALYLLPISCAAYPVFAFLRGPVRLRRRRSLGLCIDCGYNLTGNISGVCPECGTPTICEVKRRSLTGVVVTLIVVCTFVAIANVELEHVRKIPIANLRLLCSPCGLKPGEEAWLLNVLQATDRSREDLLEAFELRFPHDECMREYCLECAEALLNEAGL